MPLNLSYDIQLYQIDYTHSSHRKKTNFLFLHALIKQQNAIPIKIQRIGMIKPSKHMYLSLFRTTHLYILNTYLMIT
jgi:hypothetical protein